MRPVDQTTFGQPGGNCFSAVVASLLEVDIAEVPYFMDETNGKWHDQLDAWLVPRGFYAMHFTVNDENREYYDREKLWPRGFYILNGKSPRGDHSVIARGKDVVHDPHPLRDFLVNSVDGFVLLVPMFDSPAAAPSLALLPCYRCGKVPTVDPNDGYPTVSCDRCYSGPPDFCASGMNAAQAVADWNERMEQEEPTP